MTLRIPRGGNSLFNFRGGVRINPARQIEQPFCLLNVAMDFRYPVKVICFRPAGNGAVFQLHTLWMPGRVDL
jgi:hypothetical protein